MTSDMPAVVSIMSDSFALIVAMVNLGVTVFGGFIFLMTVKSNQTIQAILLENLAKTVARLDKTVEDLRRGDGWIQTPHKGIDREY